MPLTVATSIGLCLLIVFGKLKTDNIMANVRLKFYGTKESETNEVNLECFATDAKDIYIEIDTPGYSPSFICLDIPTAIKLAKVLRNEINKAKEVGNE